MNANNPGYYPSPIKSSTVTQSALRFNELKASKRELYALIADPSKKSRVSIHALLKDQELIDEGYNARSLVHEYGGGSLCVSDETVIFINYQDQGIYKVTTSGPELIFQQKDLRFSDCVLDPEEKFLFTVVEDHNKSPIENYLAKIDLFEKNLEIVHQGYDFYMAPKISPNGQRLVWIAWQHPSMAWDETSLFHAELDSGQTKNIKVLKHENQVSIVEPEFSPSNELYYVSDESNFWQIYHEKKGVICNKEADFAAPSWILGNSSYCFFNATLIIGRWTQNGSDRLYSIDLNSNELTEYNFSFTQIHQLACSQNVCYFLASSPSKSEAIVSFNLEDKNVKVLKESQKSLISSEWISLPESITYPSLDGLEGYGFYYPPKNSTIPSNPDLKPPLIVKCHGGPTHHFSPVFSMQIQYFTSRGFAYLLLNYSGSTGYGRAYRDRLKKRWGIIDVFDAKSCVKSLISKGLCDKERVFITGGSAGGYTALAALAFTDVFSAGTSYYGVSDPKLLAQDTHKMESHYLDSLIGPYPEALESYNKVSPLVHVNNITAPVLLLQGDEDKVVPKEQSELIYKKLKNRGINASYILFKGEQHGFRQKQNIQEALESELRFYQNYKPDSLI